MKEKPFTGRRSVNNVHPNHTEPLLETKAFVNDLRNMQLCPVRSIVVSALNHSSQSLLCEECDEVRCLFHTEKSTYRPRTEFFLHCESVYYCMV